MTLKDKIFKRLDTADIFSSPPAAINEVLSILDEEDISAGRLSQIILKDPNLTARVLKIANSTYYGYRGRVNNINQAVMIIGQNMVRCLVLSISIYNQVALKGSPVEKEFTKLWQHFLETATAAKNIALSINYEMLEEAYIAGLLHDFGRLFLLRYFEDETVPLEKLVAGGVLLIDAERERLGTDHQELGWRIASRWNLPESLKEAIGNHHPADGETIQKLTILSRIVALSDNLSPMAGELPGNLEGASYRIQVIDGCCNTMGIDMESIKKIYSIVPKEVLGSAEGMDINVGEAFEYFAQINNKMFNLYIELTSIFRERQELSRRLLTEERLDGAIQSLHIALATLSHYINNATMNISGQCEVINVMHNQGDREKVFRKIPSLTESIRLSIKKISKVLEELSNIASLENINYFKNSRAIDIEEALKNRLEEAQIQV